MADPVDSLEGKLEAAFIGLLSDAGIEELAQFMQGHDSEIQDGPYLVVQTIGGPEIPFGSGNFLHKVRITYFTPGDKDLPNETTTEEPGVVHRNLVQKAREALFVSTLEADLSAQEEDFTVSLVIPLGSDNGHDGRFFWTQDEFDVDCVGMDDNS